MGLPGKRGHHNIDSGTTPTTTLRYYQARAQQFPLITILSDGNKLLVLGDIQKDGIVTEAAVEDVLQLTSSCPLVLPLVWLASTMLAGAPLTTESGSHHTDIRYSRPRSLG